MATFFPLTIASGSIQNTTTSSIMNFMKFPVDKLYPLSSAFATRLPDPYYIQTSSANVTIASNLISASVFLFNPQGTPELQYYTTNAILGVQSNTTAGVRIGMQSVNNFETSLVEKVASTLTGFTYLCVGTADAFAFVQPATLAAANTIYPAYVQGVTLMPSGTLNNTLLLQSAGGNTSTLVTGSVFYNQFIGYSSSLSTITSSVTPLYLSGSGTSGSQMATIAVGDTVTQSVLPPTASLWNSQTLTTAVTTTSNTAWSNIFTLPSLTANTRYLVNFYLIARSAATTTGVQIRFLSGSAGCRGTIYTPVSSTAYAIQNSADGVSIINSATAWPVANTNALIWGEFTFGRTNAAANPPALQVQSEVNGSSVTVETGSIILYRALQ